MCYREREVGIFSNFEELTQLNIFSFLTKKHDAFFLEPPLWLHLKWPSDIPDAQCSCRKSRFIYLIECNTCSVIYIYCKFSDTFFIFVTNCRSREHIDWKWYIIYLIIYDIPTTRDFLKDIKKWRLANVLFFCKAVSLIWGLPVYFVGNGITNIVSLMKA